jgi:hypothetical protein
MSISERRPSTESTGTPAWARERAETAQGLYIHALVFALFNGGLFVMNWLTRGDEGSWWFQWPLMIWGMGFVIHFVTIVLPVFSSSWVDRRAAEIARRSRDGSIS